MNHGLISKVEEPLEVATLLVQYQGSPTGTINLVHLLGLYNLAKHEHGVFEKTQ